MTKKSTSRARTRLEQIRTLLSDKNFKNRIASFLETYIECEVVCKELIVVYKTKTKDPIEYKDVKIHFLTVSATMRFATVPIDEKVLKRIFSAESKKGQRSAKTLRDAIVHRMPTSELKEVNQRYKSLMADMELFLSLVK